MSEQEVREFEENIVKGANIAFQRLVNQTFTSSYLEFRFLSYYSTKSISSSR